jgi:NTP pyrophosphatase (non-canonical NTP hydrolase)
MNKITRNDVNAFKEQAIGYADSVDPAGNAIDHYQRIATKSAIYPGQGTPLGLAYVALKLNGEAGELAEHVGKAMRDDGLIKPLLDAPATFQGYALGDERRALIIKEIGDQLWYLAAACNELGISLSDAALGNLEKLCDRAERGTLRGSGDER